MVLPGQVRTGGLTGCRAMVYQARAGRGWGLLASPLTCGDGAQPVAWGGTRACGAAGHPVQISLSLPGENPARQLQLQSRGTIGGAEWPLNAPLGDEMPAPTSCARRPAWFRWLRWPRRKVHYSPPPPNSGPWTIDRIENELRYPGFGLRAMTMPPNPLLAPYVVAE